MKSNSARLSEARQAILEMRRKVLVEEYGYTDVGWRCQKDSTKYPDGFISCYPPYAKTNAHDRFGRMRNERRNIWRRGKLFSRMVWDTTETKQETGK